MVHKHPPETPIAKNRSAKFSNVSRGFQPARCFGIERAELLQFGQDRFFIKETGNRDNDFSRSGIDWGNATGTLRWNHLFHDQLFANTSLIFSNYQFNIFNQDRNGGKEYQLDYLSGIRDWGLKYDLDYLPSPQHSIRAGLLSTYHRFKPSALVVKDEAAANYRHEVDNIDVLETGIYAEDTYRPIPELQINGGLRLTHFAAKNKTYFRPEPRLSASYRLKENLALKGSYSAMNQFVHLLSNTGIGLPTDLWVPSSQRVAPQQSRQVALGFARDLPKHDLTLTIEGYYKKSDNIIGYKEGASFLIIDDPESAEEVNYEDNITAGQGWSYGAEFLLQRKIGKFSGWVGYTLSWTQLQFDSLNFGKKYYARYDRRHDISVIGIYTPNERITLSGTWVYGTGNAITMPQGSYQTATHAPFKFSSDNNFYFSQGGTVYGDKNSFRMGAYHRLDVGIQFHKKKHWGERTWEISLYNAYSRQNPFFYYLDTEYSQNGSSSTTKLKQISLFPVIPSFSYGFKF